MEDRIQFDVNESLKYYLSDPTSVPNPGADSDLLDCETELNQVPTSLIDSVLNPVVDAVAENPEELARPSTFDSLQFLLKYVYRSINQPLLKGFMLVCMCLNWRVCADILRPFLRSL